MLLDFESIVDKYDMKISGVIHVGAHHGQEHKRYISHGINSVVYFEPVKRIFDILVGNIKHIHEV